MVLPLVTEHQDELCACELAFLMLALASFAASNLGLGC